MQLSALIAVVGLLATVSGTHVQPRHRGLAHRHAARAANGPVNIIDRSEEPNMRRSKRDPNVWIRKDKRGGSCKVRPGAGSTGSTGSTGSKDSTGSTATKDSAGSTGSAAGSTASTASTPPTPSSGSAGAGSAIPAASSAASSAAPSAAVSVATPKGKANASPAGGAPAAVDSGAAPAASSVAVKSSAGSASTPTASGSANTPATTGSQGTYSGNPIPGKKAGLSSGVNIEQFDGLLGWWYDWTPNPSGHDVNAIAVPMLWGINESNDENDNPRWNAWQTDVLDSGKTFPYVIGYEEPDCEGNGSCGMLDPKHALDVWNEKVMPMKQRGSAIISPSMCKQLAETWLTEFESLGGQWDITNVHINKNTPEAVEEAITYYYEKFGQRKLWITEFACVNDAAGPNKDKFEPCTDIGEITDFIAKVVPMFDKDDRVAAYAFSNGQGLDNAWVLATSDGSLSEAGDAYKKALQAL